MKLSNLTMIADQHHRDMFIAQVSPQTHACYELKREMLQALDEVAAGRGQDWQPTAPCWRHVGEVCEEALSERDRLLSTASALLFARMVLICDTGARPEDLDLLRHDIVPELLS